MTSTEMNPYAGQLLPDFAFVGVHPDNAPPRLGGGAHGLDPSALPEVRVMALEDALAEDFETDAHCVPYIVVRADGTVAEHQYPMTKAAAFGAALKDGEQVLAKLLISDLDRRPHDEWGALAETQEARATLISSFTALGLPPLEVFPTKRGFRAIHEIERWIPYREALALHRYILDTYARKTTYTGVEVDTASWRPVQCFRLPRVTRGGVRQWERPWFIEPQLANGNQVVVPEGLTVDSYMAGPAGQSEPVTVATDPKVAEALKGSPLVKEIHKYLKKYAPDLLILASPTKANVPPHGERDKAINREVWRLCQHLKNIPGVSGDVIYHFLSDWVGLFPASEADVPPLDNLEEKVSRIWGRIHGQRVLSKERLENQKGLDVRSLNHLMREGVSCESFRPVVWDYFANSIRYHAGTWYRWDGRVWVDIAKEPIDTLWAEEGPVKGLLKLMETFHFDPKSPEGMRLEETKAKMKALLDKTVASKFLEAAAGECSPLILPSGKMARSPFNAGMAFPVANGTLRLSFEPPYATFDPHHRPEDLFTRVSPVVYDPTKKAPKFMRFLNEMVPSRLQTPVFQMLGAALAGVATRLQRWCMLLGKGNNGKSVFFSVIQEIFGQFFTVADEKVYTEQRNASHSTDKAALDGARLILVSETHDKQTLKVTFFKEFADGTPQTARGICKDPYVFIPRGLVFCTANSFPRVFDQSIGFRRRAVIVPIDRIVDNAKIDPKLSSILVQEASGVLNLLVEGWIALAKADMRLAVPDEVKEATEKYLDSQSVLRIFIQEECFEDSEGSCVEADLFSNFCLYLDRVREASIPKSRFREELDKLGYKLVRTQDSSGRRTFTVRGVRLPARPQTIPAPTARIVDQTEAEIQESISKCQACGGKGEDSRGFPCRACVSAPKNGGLPKKP